ncbi:hypothetical protein [Proteus terrae]|uniref:tail fiber/spike domain-containing protein n=1 Tax=Proteus terrae TaxID=1574161 RepID=UPI0032DAB566
MTVSTELSHEEYVGNGVTTDFDFRFRIFESRHLIVVVADNDGNETTLKNGTDYTIVGAGSYHGGKVVLNKPLARGWTILLERDLPVVQETDLRNQGKFFAEVHEDAFDYLTMLIQKALGTFSLSLRKPTYLSNYYDAKGNRIANLASPKVGTDAANKDYVDNSIKYIDSKTLRVKDKPIPALPSSEQRRNKQLGFDNEGYPQLLDPAETGSLGYILVDSFEKGAEITTRYQALHFENNGEYYRWDGELPKSVLANSTPENSGGIGIGKWIGIGDASARTYVENNFDKLSYLKENLSNLIGGNIGDIQTTSSDGYYYISTDPTLIVESNTNPSTDSGWVFNGNGNSVGFYASQFINESMTDREKTETLQYVVYQIGRTGGGTLFIDRPITLIPIDSEHAGLHIAHDNVHIKMHWTGKIRVKDASHSAIYVSKTTDKINEFTTERTRRVTLNVDIEGNGEYLYSAANNGRGILARRVEDFTVSGCNINNMSMIGIDVQSGAGYLRCVNNNLHGNKWGAIAYNGRCFQSIIANNICSGSDVPNSVAIQTCGHSIVHSNTVYGSLDKTTQCGGISWGEGDFTGIGSVSFNLIKHCSYGVKSVLHGTCNITGNIIINCKGNGGIISIGTSSGSYPTYGVSQRNLISGNHIINCFPNCIDSTAQFDVIQGNHCLYISDIKNPSATTEPDAIEVIRPNVGILLRGDFQVANGNTVRGCNYNIAMKIGTNIQCMGSNNLTDAAIAPLAYLSKSKPGVFPAPLNASLEIIPSGTGSKTVVYAASKPTKAFLPAGTLWNRNPLDVGKTMGELAVRVKDTSALGNFQGNQLTILDVSGIDTSSGNIINIELSDGAYHSTSVTSISGNVITLDSTPSGKDTGQGMHVYWTKWHQLSVI